MPVPKFLQPVLWSKDVQKLDVARDRDYIVHQVLSRGTLKDVRWLAKAYDRQTIRHVFVRHPVRSYSPAALNFSSKFIVDVIVSAPKKYVQTSARNS